jgi:hypothetical protein
MIVYFVNPAKNCRPQFQFLSHNRRFWKITVSLDGGAFTVVDEQAKLSGQKVGRDLRCGRQKAA